VVRRPHCNDLFAIFPDLPAMPHRSPEDQIAQVRRNVEATRARAYRNIARQREAAERVRIALSPRRRRR